MPIIFATSQTVIRQGEKAINVKAGKKIAGSIFPGKGQLFLFRFAGDDSELGVKQDEEFSIYCPHWQMPDLWSSKPIAPEGIKLNVPYFAQCDSRADGYRYCFSHACAMMAAHLLGGRWKEKASGYAQPENYYIEQVLKYGDTTDSGAQLQALNFIGIAAKFSQTISPKDLYLALQKGIPLPIGVAYKASGHWITLVGSEKGAWLVHDPYGIRNGATNEYPMNSTDQGKEGAFDKYSPSVMDSIYFDQRTNDDRECGWAIVPTAYKTDLGWAPTGLGDL
jgi:hypothetical protein